LKDVPIFKEPISEAETLSRLAASAAHSRKMFDRISGLAQIGVWECDLATGRLTWTDAVYDLFEFPRGTLVDRERTVELYEETSRIEMERARARAIESGIGFTLDVRIRTARGNDRWIRITADIEKEDGQSARIFGTKQDITAERAAQDKLRSLQMEFIHVSRVNAMDTMASTLAHEVNQRLAAAANYMSAALRMAATGTMEPDLSRCVEEARKLIMDAGETIHRLRDRSSRVTRRRETSFEQIVHDAVTIATAGQTGVSIAYDLAPAASIAADPIAIQHVVISLIRNSCEARPGATSNITIRTVLNPTHLEVYVEDAGPGIPGGMVAKIFEPHTTTKSHGLGMGLSVSRTIVEAHGGRMTASNLPEGGASVCFTVPLWLAEPSRASTIGSTFVE